MDQFAHINGYPVMVVNVEPDGSYVVRDVFCAQTYTLPSDTQVEFVDPKKHSGTLVQLLAIELSLEHPIETDADLLTEDDYERAEKEALDLYQTRLLESQ